MKKIAAIAIAILIATNLLQAHEMEGGSSTSGLFGLKAEYIHALLYEGTVEFPGRLWEQMRKQ